MKTAKPHPAGDATMADNPRTTKKQDIPPQHQDHQPGTTAEMQPKPRDKAEDYKGAGKLKDLVALITGGDSGIGRSVALHYAKEGADIAIIYLNEHDDANETKRLIEQQGRRCITLAGDVGKEAFCRDAVTRTVETLGRLDILVNNAAEQHEQHNLEDITEDQLVRTFRTNIFGYFFMAKAALPHLKPGSAIINSTSITAYRGNPLLIDYSSTKGAILGFTRSLATNLADKKIRVNGVAPAETWTPLIPASFNKNKVEGFGNDQPLGGPAQPDDVAPSYVFLATPDSRFMTGQTLHPNGGEIIGG